jgi:hypothetical protein
LATNQPEGEAPGGQTNGPVANDSILDAIRQVAAQYAACTNSGEFLRLFGLYTDRALISKYGSLLQDASFLSSLEGPPIPRAQSNRMTVQDIQDSAMETLDRVGVHVAFDDPLTPTEPDRYYFELVSTEDTWLIDRSDSPLPSSALAPAGQQTTPTPVTADSGSIAPTPVPAGAIVVEVQRCAAGVDPLSDSTGACGQPADGVKTALAKSNGAAVAVAATDSTGQAEFGDLPAGSYSLRLIDEFWCLATSDSIDKDGNLVVSAGAEVDVVIYLCD